MVIISTKKIPSKKKFNEIPRSTRLDFTKQRIQTLFQIPAISVHLFPSFRSCTRLSRSNFLASFFRVPEIYNEGTIYRICESKFTIQNGWEHERVRTRGRATIWLAFTERALRLWKFTLHKVYQRSSLDFIYINIYIYAYIYAFHF